MKNTSVIIIGWDEKEEIIRCANVLWESNPGIHTIFIDNGSVDGTSEWLAAQGTDFVYFDEGIQPYGRAINVVLENFELQENIIIITPNYQPGKECLREMVKTLDTDEKVGVVGVCSNSEKNEQNLPVASIEELAWAEEQRKEKKALYTIGCDGLCIGMKRSLLLEVGYFDEELAYADVFLDYQLRCIMKGYINRIAVAACVFDWGLKSQVKEAFKRLRSVDRDILRKKWNTNYFRLNPKTSLIDAIREKEDAVFSLLEVGCDTGANLLGIKNKYPNAQVYGLEINENATAIGSQIMDIRCGNIEDEKVDFGRKFDYIVFGDVLEHLHNPEKTIRYCRGLLTQNGRIVASIPNLMHITVMAQLLKGRFHYTDVGLLDRTHIHLFTLIEIVEMFQSAGFEMEDINGIVYELLSEERELVNKLMMLSDEAVSAGMYETYQYITVARMKKDGKSEGWKHKIQ